MRKNLQMTEEEVIDIWSLFRAYIDKKQLELAAEHYVDLIVDYGVSDEDLINTLGHDTALDNAINYYLDAEDEDGDNEDY